MLTGENIKTDPNLDKIKKWYEPIAKKYYTDNPDKMHLSLRYIVDNFNKTYSIAPTKKIEDYKGTKDGVRFALLKIFELTEGLNH
ncbi:MAG: hypothetical protein PHY08_10130 [Candidatus Cloacimonetes bacterium]|nr:hypothetical protein [Candidatus Cloacimonadota bacterium]